MPRRKEECSSRDTGMTGKVRGVEWLLGTERHASLMLCDLCRSYLGI